MSSGPERLKLWSGPGFGLHGLRVPNQWNMSSGPELYRLYNLYNRYNYLSAIDS